MEPFDLGFSTVPPGMYPPGMTTPHDEARLKRQDRIRPLWDSIMEGIPPVPIGRLQQLIKDLKEEGNANFKEKDYFLAGEHYTRALIVSKMLQTHHLVEVDNCFVSAIFSNRAACCLKMDLFDQAVEDCEYAISLNKENIKAYYRKTCALKFLKQYNKAVEIAKEGERKAVRLGKNSEAENIRELLREVESHVMHQESSRKPATVRATSINVSEIKKTKQEDVDFDWIADALKQQKKMEKERNAPKKKKKAKNKVTKAKPIEQELESSSSEEEDEVEHIVNGTSHYDNNMYSVLHPDAPAFSPSEPVRQTSWQTVGNSKDEPKPSSVTGLDDFSVPPYTSVTSIPTNSLYQAPPLSVPPPTLLSLPPSLSSKYDHCMACDYCYTKVGEGTTGFQHKPLLQHQCAGNILLAKPKGVQVGYVKIRPRNNKVNFTGKFRLCEQFQNCKPCRVKEAHCSFGHNIIELDFWNLDREGAVDIAQLLQNQSEIMQEYHRRPIPEKRQMAPQVPPLMSIRPTRPEPTVQAPRNGLAAPRNGQGAAKPGFGFQAKPPATVVVPGAQEVIGPGAAKPSAPLEGKLQFPLKATYNYKVVCDKCLVSSSVLGLYLLQQGNNHHCLENLLAVQMKNYPHWYKVRERKNHRQFNGQYKLCRHFTAPTPTMCSVGEDNCSFAHNIAEQQLWTKEKEGTFNIQEFILQQRHGGYQGFTVEEVVSKHGGIFTFICGVCFSGRPPVISVENPRSMGICSAAGHSWDKSKMLIHACGESITPIAPRPFFHKTAYFLMCHSQRYCRKRLLGQCTFAHSMVERDLWMLERDTGFPREKIADESKMMQAKAVQSQTQENRMDPSATLMMPRTTSDADRKPTAAEIAASLPVAKPTGFVEKPTEPQATGTRSPYNVVEVCSICWKNGIKSGKNKNGERCLGRGLGHVWAPNRICLLTPKNVQIRPLPKKIPSGLKFIICRHVREKGKCDYNLGGYCQFAHSQEEIEVWAWMVQNEVRTLDELVAVCTKATSSQTTNISKGQSVVNVNNKPAAPSTQRPTIQCDLALNAYYCQYCSVQFASQKKWDDHCASDSHMFNVNSDKEHQWNYRQPPWGVPDGNYRLCTRHLQQRCPYGNKPEIYNLCHFAHSHEELDEWKERWQWRKMKREMARNEGMYSYMEALQDDLYSTEQGLSVVTEETDFASITCSGELKLYSEDKSYNHEWTFLVDALQMELQKVALLHNKDRRHFTLKGPGLADDCQMSHGDSFLVSGRTYQVSVTFKASMFGSFSQWVVFDFGMRPVVVRKLNVEVGTKFIQDKVKRLRQQLKFERWTNDNRMIVPYTQNGDMEDFDKQVMKRYRAPESAEAVITQQSVGIELNRHNYVHKMHKILQIEELTRHKIVSSYNLKTQVELLNMIHEEGAMICPGPSELFIKVPLTDYLTEDTDAGKLILESVRRVLLALLGDSATTVYEAIFVNKEQFNYDGRGKEHIYICLSARCCQELGLNPGDEVSVEIQFQMDTLPFCRMHYALDNLESTSVVFPDVSRFSPLRDEYQPLILKSSVLNQDQMKIVEHIVCDRRGYTPPLIVYGPFGTGKTETLAQAAMVLIKAKPSSKILICAHSNSAADLYITKHFDAFASQEGNRKKILRVYFKERRVNTVQPEVLQYCLLTPDRSSFRAPTQIDLEGRQVIVTTLGTSLLLRRLGLQGHFTHIFMDEAGQAVESQAIMPLTLANERTCVVLAGDHMQMSPKVYSPEAKLQRYHRSLLQRLYTHYDNYYQLQDQRPLTILLRMNYRTRMEILRFIAAVIYGGPDMLIPMADVPEVKSIVPLTFYSAQGQEVQDADSTSYYNVAEIGEVADRVAELYEKWPVEWGPRRAEQIGVITPYADQVYKIRSLLRQKAREYQMRDLKKVVVERVANVQGKEMRALFISTVRTRHLVEQKPSLARDAAECDGDNGDFGFLSDQKLLNTALTRAQSLVAVVGDPVALCSIGECSSIWRTFLKHCQKMGSINPITVTLESIRIQVYNLMNSTAHGENITRLNALAREGGDEALSEQNEEEQSNASGEMSDGLPERKVSHASASESVASQGSAVSLEESIIDNRVDPTAILLQLAQDSLSKGNEAAMLNGGLKMEHVTVEEKEGHAVVSYSTGNDPNQTALLDKSISQTLFEFDIDDHKTLMNTQMVNPDYSADRLTKLLASNPECYKRCILHMESMESISAEVMGSGELIREIRICSTWRCGRAFDGDEVLVELMPPEADDLDTQVQQDGNLAQGQVLGIFSRSPRTRHGHFVCYPEADNTGLMVPINRGVPKIYNLETVSRSQKTRKGYVCVYKLSKDNEISSHHYEQVDPSDSSKSLFIVKFLELHAVTLFPLGIVIGVLPVGDTIETGRDILDVEYDIPKHFTDSTIEEIDQLYSNDFLIPAEAYKGRTDYASKLAITIDSDHSEGMDGAFTIESQPDGSELLGIHVPDISYFVDKDSLTDKEAFNRACSILSTSSSPIRMLPEKLSTNLCSLDPYRNRLTVSVFLTVSQTGAVVNVVPKRCIINVKHRLTYHNVETLLKGSPNGASSGDNVQNVVQVLNRLAQLWRTKRLGNAAHCHSVDQQSTDTPQAYLLVEEIVIQANHQVATLLVGSYPDCTPLLCQPAPNDKQLEAWRNLHLDDARNNVALTQPFLPRGFVCRCTGACTCVPRPHTEASKDVLVTQAVWEKLLIAVENEDLFHIRQLVCSPHLHPQSAVALLHLQDLLRESVYQVSGDVPSEGERWHYQHNLPVYTHFTAPLNRYLDLVVQRLIHSLIDNVTSPYGQTEMRIICSRISGYEAKANAYEQAVGQLSLSMSLAERPLLVSSFVESVGSHTLQLVFPTVNDMPNNIGKLETKHVCSRQKINDSSAQENLHWKLRIYDKAPSEALEAGTVNDPVVLDPRRDLYSMPAAAWYQVWQSVIDGNILKIMEAVFGAENVLVDSSETGDYDHEVSSEINAGKAFWQQYAFFQLPLTPSSVVRVQVTAKVQQGLLSPCLQLFSISNQLDVCLEHQVKPTEFFVTPQIAQKAAKQNYKDLRAYRKAWLPVLSLEGTDKLVSSKGAIIHNLKIKWHKVSTVDGNEYKGTVQLPLSFCLARHLDFNETLLGSKTTGTQNAKEQNKVKELQKQIGVQLSSGFVCIRYSHLPCSCFSSSKQRESGDMVSWSGHGLVVDVSSDEEVVTVQVKLCSGRRPPPSLLMAEQMDEEHLATVEWLPKEQTIRSAEEMLVKLEHASDLAKNLVLGRNLHELDASEKSILAAYKNTSIPCFPELNKVQEMAVHNSLVSPFSLIQGPAGTGKTMLGVYLTCLFVQANRKRVVGGPFQVMICAPTERALDIITGFFVKMGTSCPKLVRVYSQEAAEGAKQDPDAVMESIALHNLVRQAGRLTEVDALMQEAGRLSLEQRAACLEQLHQAEVEQLRMAEVVLCTCTASTRPSILQGCTIQQVLIDEASMCTEPETFISVVNSGAKQVVLIADQHQLQPAVSNETAKILGLSRSLFERYRDKAKVLTTQYRMHEGIAAFPAEFFYGDSIEMGSAELSKQSAQKFWPNSRGRPVAFCHIMGKDEMLPDDSHRNMQEAAQAVRVAKMLVLRYHVRARDIWILSQYEAQCDLIQELVQKKGEKDVSVSTVLQSQGGECDYVIFTAVRSLPKSHIEPKPTKDWMQKYMGCATNSNQINVAITRAKKGLIIIGNKYLLQCDPMWRRLLIHYSNHKKIVDAKDFMSNK